MYRTSEKTSLSRKMAALEDRWRKCQEDRYVLELKFKEVLKGLADKNEGNKLLKIKEKYNRFLEHEDARNERNDGLLRTLDKIESQACMLSAKTERLKLLKLHYEAYMKRMYPTWENEVNPNEVFANKGSVYAGSLQLDNRNFARSTPRDEVMPKNNYASTPFSPRHRDGLHVNPEASRSAAINGQLEETFPKYQIGSVNAGRSTTHKNALQPLSHDLFRVGMDSEGKITDSCSPSFEQEENTSKDLLNVSLSEDNCIENSTVPVDIGKERKGHVSFHSSGWPSEHEEDRISVNANHIDDQGSDNRLINPNQGNVFDDNVAPLVPGDTQSDRVSQLVRGNNSDVHPSVVVTPYEDDNLDQEVKVNGEKLPPIQRSLPSHERSDLSTEGDVAEVEGVVQNDRRNEVEEGGGVEYSPRPSTSFGDGQRNIEEPYQFSSSDADYDELENQMAALVEGRRNDASKHLGTSEGEGVLNENVNNGESPQNMTMNMRDPASSSGAQDEEVGHLRQVSNYDDRGGAEGENDSRENYTFSEKDEDDFIAGEHFKETGRGEEYNPAHGETVLGNVSGDTDKREIEKENADERTWQNSESYYDQNERKDEGFDNEGNEEEVDNHRDGRPGNETKNDLNVSPGTDEHGGIQSVEGSESYHNDDMKGFEVREQDPEYIRDGNIDLSAEKMGDNHYSQHIEDPQSDHVEEEAEEEKESIKGKDAFDVEAPNDWHENESQEEKWGDNSTDEVGNVAQENQQSEVQENMEINNDYRPEQEEQEPQYGDQITESMNYPVEVASRNYDEMHTSYEEGQKVEETEPEYATYEQGEINEIRGEETERSVVENDDERNSQNAYANYEEEREVISNENYAQDAVEPIVGEQMNDEADKSAVGTDDRSENMYSGVDIERENNGEELKSTIHEENNVPIEVQERTGIETDMRVGDETTEETSERKEEEEKISEYLADDTKNELEEPKNKLQEQKSIEKADTPESVETNPDITTSEESREVNQEEIVPKQISEIEMHSTSDTAAEKEIQKIIPEEVHTVPQKVNKKEEAHSGKPVKGSQRESTRKDTEHHAVEKADKSKETPQIPSRPQSRQSGRKEGSSPDTYKGEKLKTAIRKFQAKKDTRQTTRRPTDSKK